MEMKIRKSGKHMTLVEGKHYRVCTISRLTDISGNLRMSVASLPISEGLGLEERLKGGSYVVLAFVIPGEEGPSIEPVGLRVLASMALREGEDMPSYYERMQELMNSALFAADAVKDALADAGDECD